jgi:predicted ATP-grasp superfamily ATP-dependent carboligase
VEPGQEESTLRALTAQCDHTVLVAPETGGVLAERAGWIASAGGSHLGSTVDAIKTTGDKLVLAGHLTSLGIATLTTEHLEPRDGRNYLGPFPAVVKPIDGAGSEHSYVVADRQGFAALPEIPGELLIQDFQPGEPMSASFLVGENGEAHLLGVGWQAIANRNGRLRYEGGRLPGTPDRALGEPLSAVWSIPGLRGFVGVDFIWNDVTMTASVIEINPRVTTSYVGLIRYLGVGNVARAWLGVITGTLGREDVRRLIARPRVGGLTFSVDGTITTDPQVIRL